MRGAAVALRRDKWFPDPVACHGLASSGELLLDMAAAFDDDTYREWAEKSPHVFTLAMRTTAGAWLSRASRAGI
ncbi:hypothetical protein V2I01_23545 [Micromonospora sp. BRA006-A]|nr:hypothetical protein [Micromonospora sp. BRA006-A]